MKGFLLRSRQVSPYVAGLLGRLQLPCPRLAGLIVSFSSVCLGSSGLLRVAGAVFGLAQILGLPALSAQSCSVGFSGLGTFLWDLWPYPGFCQGSGTPLFRFSAWQAFRF